MSTPIKHILILYSSLKKRNLNVGTLGSYSTHKYSFLLKRWQKSCESQSCILEYDESVLLKCHGVIHNICTIAMVWWHLIVVLWALTSSCVLRSTYTYTYTHTWISNYHAQEFVNKSVTFHMKLHIWILDALSMDYMLKLVKKWGVLLRGKWHTECLFAYHAKQSTR